MIVLKIFEVLCSPWLYIQFPLEVENESHRAFQVNRRFALSDVPLWGNFFLHLVSGCNAHTIVIRGGNLVLTR